MKKSPEHQFAVYCNTSNKHVTIHQRGINILEKRGSIDSNKQGGEEYFVERHDAEEYAKYIRGTKKTSTELLQHMLQRHAKKQNNANTACDPNA